MPNDLKTFREAGVDAFTGGFQVRTARSYTRAPQIWANSNLEIQKVLLAAFPKQATNPKQRERAGRWLRIIHLYFRLGYTQTQVAQELQTTSHSVNSMLRSITRARKGKRADTNNPRGKAKGRPKSMPYNRGTTKVA